MNCIIKHELIYYIRYHYERLWVNRNNLVNHDSGHLAIEAEQRLALPDSASTNQRLALPQATQLPSINPHSNPALPCGTPTTLMSALTTITQQSSQQSHAPLTLPNTQTHSSNALANLTQIYSANQNTG